jgi:hypothetical protein
LMALQQIVITYAIGKNSPWYCGFPQGVSQNNDQVLNAMKARSAGNKISNCIKSVNYPL